MRYHLIINGFSTDAGAQAEELNGFRKTLPVELEEGEALLICPGASAESLPVPGKKVKKLTMPAYTAEGILNILCGWMKPEDLYIFGNGSRENELAVRSACRMQGSSLADVSCVAADEKGLLAEKMVYASHMKGTFLMKKGPFCVTLEKGTEKAEVEEKAEIAEELCCEEKPEYILSEEYYLEDKETGLENADIVVIGGRGCGNKEAVDELGHTAEVLGGQLGVSRPAAMSAWAPMDKLVGVSGAMIRPKVCITAGVSGAAAFYAGIEKSGLIIAVNRDEKAPIMKKADVAIADDFRPVLQRLTELAGQD